MGASGRESKLGSLGEDLFSTWSWTIPFIFPHVKPSTLQVRRSLKELAPLALHGIGATSTWRVQHVHP